MSILTGLWEQRGTKAAGQLGPDVRLAESGLATASGLSTVPYPGTLLYVGVASNTHAC